MRSLRILGHPLHGMMVVVPIGALPTAFVLDAAFAVTGAIVWHRAATAALALGWLVLLAAIVPGAMDFRANVPRRPEALRHAVRHMVVGLALAVAATANLVLHATTLDGPAAWEGVTALALGGLTVVLVAAQAYLGVGLVTVHRAGVEAATKPRSVP